MSKNKLISIYSTLSKAEITQLGKHMHSPVFNQREDLKKLFELLSQQGFNEVSAFELWERVYPGTPFSRPDFNRLCSRFLKQLESSLVLNKTASPALEQLKLADVYRQKRLDKLVGSALANAEKQLHKSTRQDASWHLEQYLVAEKLYTLGTNSQQRTGLTGNLLQASDSLDTWFIIEKLKLACSLLAGQQLSQSEEELDFLEEVVQKIKQKENLSPTISIYWHAFQMLQPPHKEAGFTAFQQQFKAHSTLFGQNEQRSLFLMAINFCIRQINLGERQYLPTMYNFYQQGLLEGWLFDQGQLSAWTFKNIVSSGLKMKDFKGVEAFLNTYKTYLPEAIQVPFYRYNFAELQLARGEFREALRTLRFFHFKDALTDLRARLVQIKAGFELGDVQLVDYQISNLRQLVQRRKELAYHRENYRNFARLVKRLINLKPGDLKAAKRLRLAILESNALVEQNWLLDQLKKWE